MARGLLNTDRRIVLSGKIESEVIIMDSYGWKIKTWNFNKDNIEQKRKEMVEWCEKWKHKYQFRSIFVNNAWAVEYKLLLHF